MIPDSIWSTHGRPCVAALPALLLAVACAPKPPYAEVDIIARNYAFTAPATLRHGKTAFRLINQGTVPHEVQLFRFTAGTSVDSAERILARGNIPDAVAELQGGVLIGSAGDTVRERLLDDLRPGAVYGLNCEFRDSAGAPQHSRLGMFAVFKVE